jgi:hypothetical protein
VVEGWGLLMASWMTFGPEAQRLQKKERDELCWSTIMTVCVCVCMCVCCVFDVLA